MDILNSIRPVDRPAAPPELVVPDLSMLNDLDLQQRHREMLLRQAQKRAGASTQAGCVSEISIVESVFDSDDYQAVLREISEFLGNLYFGVDIVDTMKVHVEVKIEGYDDSSLPIATSVETIVARASEAEVEELGYMGWLGLA